LDDLDVISFEKLKELQIHVKPQMFISFISFLDEFYSQKCHQKLVLMLNTRFKNISLITSHVGHENASSLVDNYDL
jgi:hypothetical protein